MNDEHPPIELEESQSHGSLEAGMDRRARMDEPLPVRLMAIADLTLCAVAGMERELDAFYVTLLRFERDRAHEEPGRTLVYRAENHALRVELQEGLITRGDYRPAVVEVQSLPDTEHKLIERELEYTRHKSLTIGCESLLLQDPAGNWIELVEARLIM